MLWVVVIRILHVVLKLKGTNLERTFRSSLKYCSDLPSSCLFEMIYWENLLICSNFSSNSYLKWLRCYFVKENSKKVGFDWKALFIHDWIWKNHVVWFVKKYTKLSTKKAMKIFFYLLRQRIVVGKTQNCFVILKLPLELTWKCLTKKEKARNPRNPT